mgnify:CR=1 FL=1
MWSQNIINIDIDTINVDTSQIVTLLLKEIFEFVNKILVITLEKQLKKKIIL